MKLNIKKNPNEVNIENNPETTNLHQDTSVNDNYSPNYDNYQDNGDLNFYDSYQENDQEEDDYDNSLRNEFYSSDEKDGQYDAMVDDGPDLNSMTKKERKQWEKQQKAKEKQEKKEQKSGKKGKDSGLSKRKHNKKYEKVRKDLDKEWRDGLDDSSMDIENDAEALKRAQKKYKRTKLKKNIMYIFTLFLILVLIAFGTYKTFFAHQWTGQEIAQQANMYNMTTNFEKDGIKAYISENIKTLVTDNIMFESGEDSSGKPKEIIVNNLEITKIRLKDDEHCLAFFKLDVFLDGKMQRFDCILPLELHDNLYNRCGDVIITPMESTYEQRQDPSENPFLTFEEIDEADAKDRDSAETFADNFFKILYTENGDTTPFYKAERRIENKGWEYIKMENFKLYSKDNKDGYNVECKITLKSENGVSYQTTKYLKMEPTGKSWMITAIL